MAKLPPEPSSKEITPLELYRRRRDFLRDTVLFAGTAMAWGTGLAALSGRGRADPPKKPPPSAGRALKIENSGRFSTPEARTPYGDVTTYNNFYELGLSKSDPADNAYTLKPRPWVVRITGHVKKELELDIDTLLKWFLLEERVYRMRCVEAWSMVIPWLGFPLAELIRRVEPTSNAKFVRFTTLYDPKQLPNQESRVLAWPYVEGLRMDEALNPLTFMAAGLYGVPLPGQNGAPLRLVVPWKYGFKGAKSLVELRFTQERPKTTWNLAGPREYGFYANVNPKVDHPRWSQATERRIGEFGRRKTLMFNGYADSVGQLYSGMDLEENF